MGGMTPDRAPEPEVGRASGRPGIDRLLVIPAAAAVGAIAVYIMVAIAGSLLRFEAPDEILIVSELMLAVVFLPMAFQVRKDAFVRVDVVAGQLSGRARRSLDVFGGVFGLLFFGLLTYAGCDALEETWTYGSVHMGSVELPEWIGRLVLLFGVACGFVMQLILLARRFTGRRD